MRSLEFSLERLGLDHVDIVYAHDVDVFTHGSKEASDARIREFMDGGYKALVKLRDRASSRRSAPGSTSGRSPRRWRAPAISTCSCSPAATPCSSRRRCDRSCRIASRRTSAWSSAGRYNSGILATGPKRGAHYNYATGAARRFSIACAESRRSARRHGVKLAEAALRFPLSHPAIVSVIPGGQKPGEVRRNAEMLSAQIPAAMWRALKAEGLLRADAPTPR